MCHTWYDYKNHSDQYKYKLKNHVYQYKYNPSNIGGRVTAKYRPRSKAKK